MTTVLYWIRQVTAPKPRREAPITKGLRRLRKAEEQAKKRRERRN